MSKFLDANGVTQLWKKLSLEDYPNNKTLMAVINAIDQTKADKTDIVNADWNQTDSTQKDYIENKPILASIATSGSYKDLIDYPVPLTDVDPHQTLVTDENGNAVWEERTHYTETVEGTILDNVYSDTKAEGMFVIAQPLASNLTLGSSYQVIYNGTSYDCICSEVELFGVKGLGLGNTQYMGGPLQTDHPFSFVAVPDDMVASFGVYGGVLALDGASSITISILGVSEVIHKINDKYINFPNSFLRNGSSIGSLRGTFSATEDGEYKMGEQSFAVGYDTKASGDRSHAEGMGTIASGEGSHAEGKYNIEDTQGKYAHIIGNGYYVKENETYQRSNAHTLDWEGNAWYQGDIYVGSTSGTNKDEGSKKLATEEYVMNEITKNHIQIIVWEDND